jgi:hypothetical protein
MKVLICGSRNWSDINPIKMVIDSLESGDMVIHGAAPGAGSIAGELAEKRGDLLIEARPADWNKYGKSAGPRRNIEMLNLRPDRVYAFPTSDSVGTYHAMKEAERMGIHVIACKKVIDE